MVTFNDAKRRKNIDKHGIDLADCETVFDFPMLTAEDARKRYGEVRLASYGLLNGRVVFMVWTDRKNAPHLISCRYGDKHETQRYFQEAI